VELRCSIVVSEHKAPLYSLEGDGTVPSDFSIRSCGKRVFRFHVQKCEPGELLKSVVQPTKTAKKCYRLQISNQDNRESSLGPGHTESGGGLHHT